MGSSNLPDVYRASGLSLREQKSKCEKALQVPEWQRRRKQEKISAWPLGGPYPLQCLEVCSSDCQSEGTESAEPQALE